MISEADGRWACEARGTTARPTSGTGALVSFRFASARFPWASSSQALPVQPYYPASRESASAFRSLRVPPHRLGSDPGGSSGLEWAESISQLGLAAAAVHRLRHGSVGETRVQSMVGVPKYTEVNFPWSDRSTSSPSDSPFPAIRMSSIS